MERMPLPSIISTVQSIVQWLDGTDEEWQFQLDLLVGSIASCVQMSELRGNSKTNTRSAQLPTRGPQNVRAAVSPLKQMMSDKQMRSRTAAKQSGKAALDALNGG